jgi:hypothetical protein
MGLHPHTHPSLDEIKPIFVLEVEVFPSRALVVFPTCSTLPASRIQHYNTASRYGVQSAVESIHEFKHIIYAAHGKAWFKCSELRRSNAVSFTLAENTSRSTLNPNAASLSFTLDVFVEDDERYASLVGSSNQALLSLRSLN